eukprot:GHVN01088251.1.p3 GENE.GHVN01088251.1~~GHVN01088251.1.p3  ORF type:complete len:111 (-),score=12.41 GHVN01088251.1:390-722(-)
MSINVSETHLLVIGATPSPSTLTLNGHPLDLIHQVRDVGVFYDNKLKFNHHVDTIVNRANVRINRFRHIFKSRHPSVVYRYHMLYVRPVISGGVCAISLGKGLKMCRDVC